MIFIKYFLLLVVVFLVSCVETNQINGMRFDKIDNFRVEIGKTTKLSLISKYGPPSFESPFKKDIIYYTSQNTVYKNLSAPQVEKMILYQIFLDEKGFVTEFNKYSEKEIVNLEIVEGKVKKENTVRTLFKQMLNNLQKRNYEN